MSSTPHICTDWDSGIEKYWKSWKRSNVAQALWAHVRANAKDMDTVDVIICRGLGLLETRRHPAQHKYQKFLRYKTAIQIKEILEELQLVTRERFESGITLIAENDSSCEQCEDRLYKLFGMRSALPDEQDVRRNFAKGTFIIGKQPMFKASELAVEKDKPIQGIAGLMCNPLDESKASDPLAAWLSTRRDTKFCFDDGTNIVDKIFSDNGVRVFGKMELWISKKT